MEMGLIGRSTARPIRYNESKKIDSTAPWFNVTWQQSGISAGWEGPHYPCLKGDNGINLERISSGRRRHIRCSTGTFDSAVGARVVKSLSKDGSK